MFKEHSGNPHHQQTTYSSQKKHNHASTSLYKRKPTHYDQQENVGIGEHLVNVADVSPVLNSKLVDTSPLHN